MTTITRPSELPEWAVNDVTLPGANTPNKVAPSLALRQIGFDYLALPTAQEENSWRNNVHNWIGYNDERTNTLITDLDTLETSVAAINSFDLDFQHIGTVASGRVDMANFIWQWGNVTITIPDALWTNVSVTEALNTAFPNGILGAMITTSPSLAGEVPEIITSIRGENNQVVVSAKRINLPSGVTGQEVTIGFLVWGT